MSYAVLLFALVCSAAAWNLDYHDTVQGPPAWQAFGKCNLADASPINVDSPQFNTDLDPFNIINGGTFQCEMSITAARRVICEVKCGGDCAKIMFTADKPSVSSTVTAPRIITGDVKSLELRHPSSHTFKGGNYQAELLVHIDDRDANAPVKKYTFSFLFRESSGRSAESPFIERFNRVFRTVLDRGPPSPNLPASNSAPAVLTSTAKCTLRSFFPLRLHQKYTGVDLGGTCSTTEYCNLGAKIDFDLNKLINNNEHYYMYIGRDDLPPCDNQRKYIIFKQLFTMSSTQYQNLIDTTVVHTAEHFFTAGTTCNAAGGCTAGVGLTEGYRGGRFYPRMHPLRLPPRSNLFSGVGTPLPANLNGDYYQYETPQSTKILPAINPAADFIATKETCSSGVITSPPIKPLGTRIIWSSDPEEVGMTNSKLSIQQRGMMLITQ
mmetsp:Transcript_34797/g.87521  ORF Transcript_34797/g.87521 Transcript_34797/m.87521 type:complete len:437 (-) Transcript_34797:126-1436(-)|eukprot:CAMPEP_0177645814 /NCGR_PEP_ID=MMETSP0447-20121125/9448_1 /TAXON_ID=0 /ORGANISM="Stygamoeba regulata, Strain BSH-02190019" /LENGTH=436 /DNA_ID=CAMNT_0019148319 /DNA_START=91 /DNA_END=1401 /DNA_ORIENTATION=+